MVYIIFYDLYGNYIGSLPTSNSAILNFDVETEKVDIKEKRYYLINKINEIRRVNNE